MANTQVLMGAVAALLLVVAILLASNLTERHHTVGDSLHEAVQEMKH